MIVNGQSLSPVLSCSRCVTHNQSLLWSLRDWRRTVTGVTLWLRLRPLRAPAVWASSAAPAPSPVTGLRLRHEGICQPSPGHRGLAQIHLVSVILKRIFSNLIPDSKKFPTLSAIVDVFDHIHNKRIVLVQSFLANLISKQKSYSTWFWWSIDIVL